MVEKTSVRFQFSLRFLLLAVAVIAVVAGLLQLAWRRTSNHVVIENRSSSAVVSLSVTVGGRTLKFPSIPPGGKVEARCWVDGDDSFTLAGKLSDGTQLDGNFGYVTNGMYGNISRFVIEPDGTVSFSQST